MRSPVLAASALLAASCTAPATDAPSLAPRAAEAIDPRIPVPDKTGPLVTDADVAARLAQLLATVRDGDSAFHAQAAQAERLAAAAGPPQSESWIDAQQALSALEASRAAVTAALADIDAMAAERIQAQGGLSPGNQAAISAAVAEGEAIASRERELLARIHARLGS